MENDVANIHVLVGLEHNMSLKYCIVYDAVLEEHSRAFVYGRSKVVSELYVVGRETRAKQIIDVLRKENFK